MKLLPHLPLAVGRELAEERSGLAWEQVMRLSSTTHPRAFWSPIGSRLTEIELRSLQRRINDTMEDASKRGTLQGNRYFDVTAARILRKELDLSASEASSAGAWAFVGCVL